MHRTQEGLADGAGGRWGGPPGRTARVSGPSAQGTNARLYPYGLSDGLNRRRSRSNNTSGDWSVRTTRERLKVPRHRTPVPRPVALGTVLGLRDPPDVGCHPGVSVTTRNGTRRATILI